MRMASSLKNTNDELLRAPSSFLFNTIMISLYILCSVHGDQKKDLDLALYSNIHTGKG